MQIVSRMGPLLQRGVGVPVGNMHRLMVGKVAGDWSPEPVCNLRDGRMSEGVRTGGNADLPLLEGQRLINLRFVARLSVSGHKQRALGIVEIVPCFQVGINEGVGILTHDGGGPSTALTP